MKKLLFLGIVFLNWKAEASYSNIVFITDTSTTSWTVDPTWNNADNKIEVLGCGGNGAGGINSGGGGGGGGYAGKLNVTLTGPTVQVGVCGSNAGLCSGFMYNDLAGTTLLIDATCGRAASSSTGGSAGIGDVGTFLKTGGTGGNGVTGGGKHTGGGGGGAAGPAANGGNGANGGGSNSIGGGGGGADNGATGNGSGGTGGPGGSGGGSGGNGTTSSSAAGGNGTEWQTTPARGTGGGGGATGNLSGGTNASQGGNYGGGSGGSGDSSYVTQPAGQGLLIIQWNPAAGGTAVMPSMNMLGVGGRL